MSHVSPSYQSGKTFAETPTRRSDNKVSRPGWPEIVVGLAVWAAVGLGGGSQLARLGLDPVWRLG